MRGERCREVERERERERERESKKERERHVQREGDYEDNMFTCMYLHMYTCV